MTGYIYIFPLAQLKFCEFKEQSVATSDHLQVCQMKNLDVTSDYKKCWDLNCYYSETYSESSQNTIASVTKTQ